MGAHDCRGHKCEDGVGHADADVVAASEDWPVLLDEQKLQMDHIHDFEGAAISDIGAITHIRLNIFPDGGVSRVRIFGPLAQED